MEHKTCQSRGSVPENRCSNCSKQRTQCKFGRGVVEWKDCPQFKAKKEKKP